MKSILIDKQIKCDYERLQNERFKKIREEYSIVTMPLLEISYPDFIKNMHKIGGKNFH
jgi:hypothetical protein